MAKVELKQPIVQEISENIKDAQSVVVVDYRGLTVAEDTQLRKALREAGVSYKVYKNTLVSRAVEGTEFESLREVLEGPSAFAISTTDATALREAGVSYKVYKNTLVSRAVEGTEFESLREVLEGPSAFAISTTDATAPARVLAKFAKTAPALEIKAGVVEGNYFDAEGMKAIAAVPSREELLSKLLGSLQSPITNLARVLNQIAEQGGTADVLVETVAAEEPAAEAAETPAE